MKKLIMVLLVLSISAGASACSFIPYDVKEVIDDEVLGKIHDIVQDIDEPESVEIQTKDFTDDEIYNAFKEAEDFYYCWVYGQLYGNWDSCITENGNTIIAIEHDEIKTANQLTDKLRQYFTENLAKQYIDKLNPQDRDGKLYVNSSGGVGDTMIEYFSHEAEKLDDSTYILTLHLKDMAMGGDIISQIYCEVKDGKLLFDDYCESEYIGKEDYYVYFENEYITK